MAKKVTNDNHTDRNSGVVFTRRRRLGIFSLARLAQARHSPAQESASRVLADAHEITRCSDAIRKSLDQAGLKEVSVAQDREKVS